MNFNFKSLIAFGMLTTFTFGCSWLRDEPKAPSFNSQGLDANCLKQVAGQLNYLFAGKYTDSQKDQKEVASLWQCLDETLTTFKSGTRGANTGYYTASELQQFANRYLKGGKLIERPFIDSIFNLKASILGGSNTTLTKSEVELLQERLKRFGEIIGPLSSKIKYLLDPKNAPQANKKEASVQLDIFVRELAGVLENSAGPMRWVDLNAFINEFEKYTEGGSPTALTFVKEELPLLQYFKLLLVGGSETEIEKTKWRPILTSISNAFNALSFSNNSAELLEKLSIQVQSTEAEQKRAVTQINGLLRVLKDDSHLTSHDTLVELSDHWAKVLLANSLLFPKSQGSIALKTFLDSPTLRKLAGFIFDQSTRLNLKTQDPKQIKAISENIQSFVEQAAIAIDPDRDQQVAFSISSFKEYSVTLKPLFKDESQFALFESSIDIMANARTVLLGKNTDAIAASELRSLISKGTNLYLAWAGTEKLPLMESLAQTFEIALRPPYAFNIKLSLVQETLVKLRELESQTKSNFNIPWENLNLWIKNGYGIKAQLFGDSDQYVYSYEIKKVASLIEPFRNSDDLSKQLDALSDLLKSNPFSNVKFEGLLQLGNPIYNSLNLPPLPMDLNAKNLGLLKAVLVGGTTEAVDQTEYSALMSVASMMMKDVYPLIKALPAQFKPGLDSKTVEIADVGLKTFIDFQKSKGKSIELNVLKDVIMTAGPKAGLNFNPKHLDTALTGLAHRLFQNQKTKKPNQLAGKILPDQLQWLQELLHTLKGQLIELESAYSSVNSNLIPLERTLLKNRLSDPLFHHFLETYKPQLIGANHLLTQPKLGEVMTSYYAFDLAMKALFTDVMNVVMPAYKIAKDEKKPDSNRLGMSDLTDLLTDINPLLFDLGITFGSKTPETVAVERMVTINVMTQVGNGDSFIDFDEIVEFLTMTIGGSEVFIHVRKSIAQHCFPEINDWMLVKTVPGSCLVPFYFEPKFYQEAYGQSLPQMANMVANLKPDELEDFKKAVLLTTRVGLTEKSDFTLEDIQTMALLPEYIENVFNRLDTNRDAIIQFSEAMEGFPLFCEQIEQGAKGALKGSCVPGQNPGQLQAVFGYMIMKGEAPRGIKPGDNLFRKLRAGLSMLKWFRQWNRMTKDPEVRDSLPPLLSRKDLMLILANLASSALPGDQSLPESNVSSSRELQDDELPVIPK